MAAKPKGKKPIDDDEDLELEPFGRALKDERSHGRDPDRPVAERALIASYPGGIG